LDVLSKEVGSELNGFSSTLLISSAILPVTTSSSETVVDIIEADMLALVTDGLLLQDFHELSLFVT
jgi:hypothetical protein